MDPYLRDVLDLLFRLLHVVAGIAWIGASFYFIKLDLKLRAPRDPRDEEQGVGGEYWGVHGGGFYHTQKYRIAPRELPEPLHWFKWQAYTTWLSGFALLVVLYYTDAQTRLVDPAVADISTTVAIAVSVGVLVLGWLVYDALCRTVGARSEGLLAVLVFGLVAAASYALCALLAPRAAFLTVGAMLGTIMAANVFFVIIPAQRELVRAKQQGREPDPAPGKRGKQRSVHNNYLTLPVVFTMLAGHFAFTWTHDRPWLVLVASMALTAFVRHFFNELHAGRRPVWILAVAGVAAIGLALWLKPEEAVSTAAPVSDARAAAIAQGRCASCHMGGSAPLGVRLDSLEGLRAHAAGVARLVSSGAMPPGNATGMTDEERAQLVAWARSR
jgi:uncharacterized membrane protein